MNADHTAYLQLAFRELAHFSLPGIGTLNKTLAGARIDANSNIIYPPTERFEFTPGTEKYKDYFAQLLVRRARLDETAAEQAVQRIVQEIRHSLDDTRAFDVPGIGRFVQAGNQLSFELTSEDPTLQTFGLRPVSISEVGKEQLEKVQEKREKAQSSKKKNEKKQKSKADTKAREQKTPAAKQTATGAGRRGNRRIRLLLATLAVLLVGLGALVYLNRHELEKSLEKQPVATAEADSPAEAVENPAETSSPTTEEPAATVEASKAAETATQANVPEEPKAQTNTTKPSRKLQPAHGRPQKAPVINEKPSNTPIQTGNLNATAPATAYQLVLKQVYNSEAKAREEATFWQEYGGTLIRQGQGYTILFYTSKSLAAVRARQKQMESSGDLYVGQSKIIP
jgi:hypothetical protein